MIELKNVSKIYKSKKGQDTMALKDISIKFPEKGLVFILGKSGSGKSTLLNIIGGLDKYDSGVVIINGKSTKEFKEKDFDAYRNTYMGFIFQEYNLLENYSIEQNIKISLELQHQKATKEEIQRALKQVELEDISKRKTNELSGGQKQRVAIARALIKNPEIILADEPTGNLDTQTSEQIWNILKKLSETKLVIVVSHDNESAEKYADRIIKIQDGEIISDEGEKEEVVQNKEFKLQNAKLPFFYSLKMGAGNLIHKKFRLILTTLSIIFSIICFGIMLSAYTSDVNNKTVELLAENGETTVSINKYDTEINSIKILKEQMESNNNEEIMNKYNSIEINDEFKEEVEKNLGTTWNKGYRIDTFDGNTSMVYPQSLQNTENMPMYYTIADYSLNNILFVDAGDKDINNLIGNKPQAEDEVVISSYIADNIIYRGCLAKDKDDDNLEEEKYQPKNYKELIESKKYINICGVAYLKVVGIIDNTESLKNFGELKNKKEDDMFSGSSEEMENLQKKSYQLMDEIYYNNSEIYIHASFITKMQNKKNTYSSEKTTMKYDNENYYGDMIGYIDRSLDICTNEGIKTIKKLDEDEIIINESTLNALTNYEYEISYQDNINKYSTKEEFVSDYIKENKIIGRTLKTNINNGKKVTDENEYCEYKIIGILLGDINENGSAMVYYSRDIIEPLIKSNVHFISLIKKVSTPEEMKKILKYYPIDNSDIITTCKYGDTALNAATISYMLQFIAKYGVVFFLIFAAIILMSFINSSIKFRKKEIGTLRALGCRSSDIIKMFLYESIILILITLGISFIIIPGIIDAINGFVIDSLLMEINILYFGFTQIAEISGIMILIVILANVIPVRKITKMKPIDAILNK